jgi:drug/metabolite transporter (DMT)-like permease
MNTDRPLLGILLMLGFCVTIPVADAIAKLLGGVIPLAELVLARFAAQAFLLLPIIWLMRTPFRLTPRVLKLTLIRTLLHILGIGGMFTALRHLPLADALAIAFVMPFIMLVLGRTVLGEEVGPHRIWASVVGFAGTLMVIQPSFVEVGWPALVPLGVALVFALFMLVTRQVAREVDALVLQSAGGFIALPILLALIAFGTLTDIPALTLILPEARDGWLLVACGVFGTAAHLMMTLSLRFAPSATLAPMQYLEIPVATLVGYLVFSDLPDGIAAFGILITIGAGLYVIWREHHTAGRAPA